AAPRRLALPRLRRDHHWHRRPLRTRGGREDLGLPVAFGAENSIRECSRKGVTPMLTMVIDDSRAMRLILKRIVAQLGFDVVEAANGKEAMDYLTNALDGGSGELPGLAL